MSLTPRRTLAVGLVEIAFGTAIYIGVRAGATLWTVRSGMFNESANESSVHSFISSIQSAQEITAVAFYVGGAVAVIGIVTSLVGAVRWLWSDPKAQIGVNPQQLSS